jgi:hypothetical protein
MPVWRDEAEALARAILVGLVRTSDVTAWAEAQLAAQESPHWTLGEVAGLGDIHPQDVAAALRRLPGSADPAAARSLLVQLVARKFAANESPAMDVARVLRAMAVRDEIEDEALKDVARWATYAFDCPEEYCSEESTLGAMAEALEQAAAAAALRGPRWATKL